jgi:hypothetical protein
MPGRMKRRALPVLTLLAGLVLPFSPSHAIPPSAAAPHASSPKTLGSSLWAWVAHLLEAAWRKNGMAIDPNGQPAGTGSAGTAPVGGDNGSMPDPNG